MEIKWNRKRIFWEREEKEHKKGEKATRDNSRRVQSQELLSAEGVVRPRFVARTWSNFTNYPILAIRNGVYEDEMMMMGLLETICIIAIKACLL